MAARSHGNGTNFDWLRKTCDISTGDLSPDGNPEKYGRPMKSAIKGLFRLVHDGSINIRNWYATILFLFPLAAS